MKAKVYDGINVQYPISRLILDGSKNIETRTYPLPSKYIQQDVLMIETPGAKGKFKARVVAIVRFGSAFKYKNSRDFYKDKYRHHVNRDSPWAWQDAKPKWGWPIESVVILKAPEPLLKRSGIRFATNLRIKQTID